MIVLTRNYRLGLEELEEGEPAHHDEKTKEVPGEADSEHNSNQHEKLQSCRHFPPAYRAENDAFPSFCNDHEKTVEAQKEIAGEHCRHFEPADLALEKEHDHREVDEKLIHRRIEDRPETAHRLAAPG